MKILKKEIKVEEFFKKLNNSVLILDYDGTLAPFSIDRSKSYPYPGVSDKLKQLMEIKNTRLIIVSGRAIHDLIPLLNLDPSPEIWGSHGLEHQSVDGIYTQTKIHPLCKKALEEADAYAAPLVDPKRIEKKPFSIALHWRGLNDDEKTELFQMITPAWEDIANQNSMELHRFNGGIELRPKNKNKGDVINTILAQLPKNTAIAYLGDDATDEEAFEKLQERGLKVLVKNELRPTAADLQITPPQELLEFLDRWIKGTQNGKK